MQKIIIGNLKMNLLSPAEREKYLELFKKELLGKKFVNAEIVLCPPAIHLESFGKILGKKVILGGQNCFWEDKGSYTGEISPLMLKNFGSEYVICGHSERRKYFGETDQLINLKVKLALKNNLVPVICVGETLEERKTGLTLQIITRQVKEIFSGIAQAKLEKIVVAYEPIWSVGSDVVPTANEIMEARVLIRKILMGSFAKKNVEKVRIIYGGSVSAETVKKTCLDSGMDGALIGRESLTPREFIKIISLMN
ncbi:MAG: triose-phosphate isomerase [Candidatus Moraniibacteriota bacterium]